MAMSAMLVACETPKEENNKGSDVVDTTVYVEYPTEAKVSANGVYTAKLVKEGVSLDGWGAGAGKETIKVVLAPTAVVAKVIDGTITSDADLFVDENKCYVYANNDVGNGMFTSATVVEGTYVQPAGFSEYKGLAITKDTDGNYIVKFDVSKIENAILLAKGAPKGTLGEGGEVKVDTETDPWNAVDTLKTAYVPMILGSVTANSGAAYPFNFWSAGVAIMEPSAEAYPAAVTKEAVLSYNFNDLNSYCGTMNSWASHDALDANTFTFTAAAENKFAFTVGTWSYKASGATINALDTEVALVENGGDITFADNVLTEGTDYTVTLIVKGEKEGYVKVSVAE
jgi:hypothetical protein